MKTRRAAPEVETGRMSKRTAYRYPSRYGEKSLPAYRLRELSKPEDLIAVMRTTGSADYALEAFDRIKDDKKMLVEAALHGGHREVKERALGIIRKDPELLNFMIESCDDSKLMFGLVEEYRRNKPMLIVLAQKSPLLGVRKKSVEALTGEKPQLIEVLLHSHYADAKAMAAERLLPADMEDEKTLAEFCINSRDRALKTMALGRIADPELRLYIEKNAREDYTREMARRKREGL